MKKTILSVLTLGLMSWGMAVNANQATAVTKTESINATPATTTQVNSPPNSTDNSAKTKTQSINPNPPSVSASGEVDSNSQEDMVRTKTQSINPDKERTSRTDVRTNVTTKTSVDSDMDEAESIQAVPSSTMDADDPALPSSGAIDRSKGNSDVICKCGTEMKNGKEACRICDEDMEEVR